MTVVSEYRRKGIGLLMNEPFAIRREKLLAQLLQEDVKGFLVSNPTNVSYLTGFSGDSSFLLLSNEEAVLISDGRYTTQMEEECPDLDAHIRPPAQPIHEASAELIQGKGLASLAVESQHLTLAGFEVLKEKAPSVDWNFTSGWVEQIRMVKDETELQQIKDAIWIAERALSMFLPMLKGDDTEKDLADRMESYIRLVGGKCTSFPPITAVGDRAALPHATPTNKKVQESDLLLVDWGADGGNYKSDLTRVFVPRRKFSSSSTNKSFTDELQKIYNVVLAAQTEAIRALRPGVLSGDVDAAARKVITDAGYGKQFNHSLGHGIGRDIHEGPMLRSGTKTEMLPGMVVTIEPGIYLPGWGGVRIEDDVLVTPDGCEVLSSVPKAFDEQFAEYA